MAAVSRSLNPQDVVTTSGLGDGKLAAFLAPMVAGIVSAIETCGVKDQLQDFAKKTAVQVRQLQTLGFLCVLQQRCGILASSLKSSRTTTPGYLCVSHWRVLSLYELLGGAGGAAAGARPCRPTHTKEFGQKQATVGP